MRKPLFAACVFMALAAVPAATQAQAQVPAQAQDRVSLASTVLVERQMTDADGGVVIETAPPENVIPGDTLVFVLDYRNDNPLPAENFVVTNPLPAPVAFVEAIDPGAVVSVDGGSNWGALSTLVKVADDGSERPAAANDVTHVRWTLAEPIPAGEAGQLRFRGVVR